MFWDDLHHTTRPRLVRIVQKTYYKKSMFDLFPSCTNVALTHSMVNFSGNIKCVGPAEMNSKDATGCLLLSKD